MRLLPFPKSSQLLPPRFLRDLQCLATYRPEMYRTLVIATEAFARDARRHHLAKAGLRPPAAARVRRR
jgi:hypothetical protein